MEILHLVPQEFHAIRQSHSGTVFDTSIATYNPPKDIVFSDTSRLTIRKRQIIECIIEGKSQKQIARELAISHRTLRNHFTQLRRRLDERYYHRAGNEIELLVVLLEHGDLIIR